MKNRYANPGFMTPERRWFGYRNFHHVLNLLELHRRELRDDRLIRHVAHAIDVAIGEQYDPTPGYLAKAAIKAIRETLP